MRDLQSPDSQATSAAILVLDDEPTTVAVLKHVLTFQGFTVAGATNIREAQAAIDGKPLDVAIVDVYLAGNDGLEFVRELKRTHADVGIVVISAEDTETLAKKAVTSGADYFLSKPVAPAALTLLVRKLSELRKERNRAKEFERRLRSEDVQFPEIKTNNESMRSMLRLIAKVAPRDLSVLIHGESGTGKELVARALHRTSSRATGQFVELNCAALPANLVESELFGHEKGAFTGAIGSRPGKIELADKGTLFLDEIGELPLEIQPKLLRALQEKRITRVGGKRDIECDFRLVSATHRDLIQEVRENRFREDLFYRVAVFPVKIPPLRHRLEDIEPLLTMFLEQEGVKNPLITPAAKEVLGSYQWPGNVRELKNFAQAVTLLTDREVIDELSVRSYFGSRLGEPLSPTQRTLPDTPVRSGLLTKTPVPGNRPVRLLMDIEREEILHALRVYRGNVPEAAMALGMGRATLYKYIKRNDIHLRDFES